MVNVGDIPTDEVAVDGILVWHVVPEGSPISMNRVAPPRQHWTVPVHRRVFDLRLEANVNLTLFHFPILLGRGAHRAPPTCGPVTRRTARARATLKARVVSVRRCVGRAELGGDASSLGHLMAVGPRPLADRGGFTVGRAGRPATAARGSADRAAADLASVADPRRESEHLPRLPLAPHRVEKSVTLSSNRVDRAAEDDAGRSLHAQFRVRRR
ncbi:hypothetical protein GALL_233450 [mine drainage metagenome]|uniref:Uncharacterized protein n=1 Tax=mine drainage metagenome TaxID=410659 RepID=A0A1J5RRT3_9ZZZZ